jgi:hypothetical protein
METPPPYYPPTAPAKKNNTLLILVIVFAVIAVCCVGGFAVMGYFGFQAAKQVMPVGECVMNFENMRDAMYAYAKDHEGKLPPAENWEDEVRQYYAAEVKKENLEENPFISLMPIDGPWGCRLSDEARSGMAYNLDVAGQELEKLARNTILVFEVPQPGEDLALKFESQGDSGEVVFGEKRPFMEMPVGGEMNFEAGSKGSIRVDTDAPAKDDSK